MGWPFSCILICYISSILLQSSHINAQSSGKITIGQSLSASTNGSSWLSPSGDFAFGFHQLPNDSRTYLLSIWYAKIPDTIVWYANDGEPVPRGSTVKITANEGLVLSDPHGVPIWNTTDELSVGGVVSYGYFNDTGNFQLISSSNDTAVWQSFDHPTDTLLPAQILEAGTEIDSRLSDTSFSKGRFKLVMQNDGNLVLYSRDVATGTTYGVFYASNTAGNPGNILIYGDSGHMYLQPLNGSIVDILSTDQYSSKIYYQRLTLDFDGMLTWYYHPRTFASNEGATWSKIKSIPNNICLAWTEYSGDLGSGVCGFNSICSLSDDQRPNCDCPPRYSLLDPNDLYGSCTPDFDANFCHQSGKIGANDEYKLVQLQHIDWPYADYAELPYSEDVCKSSCLNDCLCAAAVSNGTSCWKKKFPLARGRQDSTIAKTTWLKVSDSNYSSELLNPVFPPAIIMKDKRNGVVTALMVGFACATSILLCAIGLRILFMYKDKQSRRHNHQYRTLDGYTSVHCFTYKELEQATNGFKEELGRGAFGVVYKGKIVGGDSRTFIAVKKLDRMFKNADKEFTAEVNVIGQTHHKNLVRFIGFCKEEDQRLLVYECMSNGTLADYLFGDTRPSWESRIHTAEGIATGLRYLHEECCTQIIHCDIKPQNILLDDNHNARIADFGLAKLLDMNQTHTVTAIRGTKGYVSPEWFRNKPITVKVDVFSFGVLLLEIICCRKNIRMDIIDMEGAILTDWAFDCYQSNRLDSLVNDDMEALNDRLRLVRFVMVALWCIQEDPSLRPTMRTVVQMIEGVIAVPSPPCPDSFSVVTQA